jgi:hypothetical protein
MIPRELMDAAKQVISNAGIAADRAHLGHHTHTANLRQLAKQADSDYAKFLVGSPTICNAPRTIWRPAVVGSGQEPNRF